MFHLSIHRLMGIGCFQLLASPHLILLFIGMWLCSAPSWIFSSLDYANETLPTSLAALFTFSFLWAPSSESSLGPLLISLYHAQVSIPISQYQLSMFLVSILFVSSIDLGVLFPGCEETWNQSIWNPIMQTMFGTAAEWSLLIPNLPTLRKSQIMGKREGSGSKCLS